ncbi:MAG TPA: DUF92 domain-containing protein [Gemmatimonadales bacterium]
MKWLTPGGAGAALAVGAATVWGLGWRGFVLLLAFFVSGSLLTKGGGQRNARQVVANGGVAAVAALFGAWPIAAGALAAAAADTWATEIGAFSPTPPRLITSGAPVPRGTHGGITPLGTAGGVLGAVVLGGLAAFLEPRAAGPGLAHPGWTGAVVAGAGVVGMLVDSLLGATLQGPDDAWLDNDGVNLATTLAGAGVAAAGWRLCC